MSLKLVISIVATFVLLGLGGFLIKQYGSAEKEAGGAIEKALNNEAIVKEIKKYEDDRQKIRKLNDDELLSDYCEFVVFTIPYDQCVQTVKIYPSL